MRSLVGDTISDAKNKGAHLENWSLVGNGFLMDVCQAKYIL